MYHVFVRIDTVAVLPPTGTVHGQTQIDETLSLVASPMRSSSGIRNKRHEPHQNTHRNQTERTDVLYNTNELALWIIS